MAKKNNENQSGKGSKGSSQSQQTNLNGQSSGADVNKTRERSDHKGSNRPPKK